MTHIFVSKLTNIVSDNGLSPGRPQAIWTNAGILLIGPLGTNFNETSIQIHSRKSIWNCHLENGVHSVFGLNVLKCAVILNVSIWLKCDTIFHLTWVPYISCFFVTTIYNCCKINIDAPVKEWYTVVPILWHIQITQYLLPRSGNSLVNNTLVLTGRYVPRAPFY